MKVVGNRFNKCIYAVEFPDNHVYIGLTDNIDRRFSQHISIGPVKNHIRKTKLVPVIKQLTNYIDVYEASNYKEGYYQRKYIRKGWVPLYKAPPGAKGGGIRKWFYKNCKEEALKYKTKISFLNSCPGAYNASHKMGWLKSITSHM